MYEETKTSYEFHLKSLSRGTGKDKMQIRFPTFLMYYNFIAVILL
jgi:hypothetical protein